MNVKTKLNQAEFIQMIELLKRYSQTNMDQWELLKFQANQVEIFVSIGLKPGLENTEDSYTDISHLLGDTYGKN